MTTDYEIIILGGGLSGGLLGLALKAQGLNNFLIVERGQEFGGRHTWSFHGGDVSARMFEIIKPCIRNSWGAQQVIFPDFTRTLPIPFHMLRSQDLHRHLLSTLSPTNFLLGTDIKSVDGNTVTLAGGVKYSAQTIFDSRAGNPSWLGDCNYQKFLSLELFCNRPHGLSMPVLDAAVSQDEGFHFMHVLPTSERQLVVEDSRYSDTDILDSSAIRHEILSYCRQKWAAEGEVIYEERAALPIPLNLKFYPKAVQNESVYAIGSGAGFFHPSTGLSMAYAARTAEEIAKNPTEIAESLEKLRKKWYSEAKYYVRFNRLKRHDVFNRFYKCSEPVIKRFYSAQLNPLDKIRIMGGKSPTLLLGID